MVKKGLKTFSWIVIVLLIIHIPLFLYLFNFRLIVFNENYYRNEFQKYNVYGEFPAKDINKINHDLLLYLKNDKTQNRVNINFFNQKEKEHLLDVKNLIQKSILSFYIVIFDIIILVIILFYLMKKKIKRYIPIILIWGGALNFIDAFIFYLLVKFNFVWIFSLFHRIFFEPGTWVFDTNIVELYPLGFFYDITAKIVLNTLIMALIVIIIGVYLYRSIKIKKYINKRKK